MIYDQLLRMYGELEIHVRFLQGISINHYEYKGDEVFLQN